jgi:hypothetical protein
MSNKIGQGINIIHMEEALILCEYGMEMIGHCDPILYVKLVLAFKFYFLVFVVSFSNLFQFLVFFISLRMKSTCSLSIQIHRKLRNAFIQPYPSPTRALLLNSCKLQTWSPWPNLWHAANTKRQFVLHDLPFI